MKQIAQNYKSGELSVLDVPVPACKPGGVLVRTEFSLISAGTEMMKVQESKLSLVGKARARPDQVKKVLESMAQQGPLATYRKVAGKLDSYTPLGYSTSGIVVEVGDGADGFEVGQRVACGGNQFAFHAEYNWVPKNLCVPMPEGVASADGAYATVGAIAMQGFRQSEAKLGESACVIGLGLVGLLLVQILQAAGLRVFGIDPDGSRCALAEQLGAVAASAPDGPTLANLKSQVKLCTDGMGIDYVFLTAGGKSNGPVELAAELARDRAMVVDIGKCSLDLPWNAYYEKELELRFSRSYGPGRYDPNYEERGIDYPIGYIRWTERRNMQSFLELIRAGQIDVSALTSQTVAFEDASAVYEKLNSGELKGIGTLFKYRVDAPAERRLVTPKPKAVAAAGEAVKLGVIGAGNYASSMLLPHLAKRADVQLVEVATATALSAANAAKKFGFDRVSTDYQGLLADSEIDAVLIATRHGSHASMVCDALRAGKAVFVEKPLAINDEQLKAIRATMEETGNDRVMVGFNRRFAPMLLALKDAWGDPVGPQVVQYRVNAGPLAAGSWYADARDQGSRFVGEGCHFVDTISWWLGSEPVAVSAASAKNDPDNMVVTLSYPDGSIATVAYLTDGDPRYPKEAMEVFGEGKVAKMDNFQRIELWQGGRRQLKKSTLQLDKGQKDEMAAFVDAVKSGSAMPISVESLFATTKATFGAMASAADGVNQAVGDAVAECRKTVV